MKLNAVKNDDPEPDPENKLQVVGHRSSHPIPEVSGQPKELAKNSQTETGVSTAPAAKHRPIKLAEHDGKLSIRLNSEKACQQTFGTTDPDLLKRLAAQLQLASPKTPLGDAADFNSSLAALYEINPHNAVEGMLAVQMVSIHSHLMDTLRRAIKADTHNSRDVYENQVVKLARTFALQAVTLNNLRSSTATNVLVKYVNINHGGDSSEE